MKFLNLTGFRNLSGLKTRKPTSPPTSPSTTPSYPTTLPNTSPLANEQPQFYGIGSLVAHWIAACLWGCIALFVPVQVMCFRVVGARLGRWRGWDTVLVYGHLSPHRNSSDITTVIIRVHINLFTILPFTKQPMGCSCENRCARKTIPLLLPMPSIQVSGSLEYGVPPDIAVSQYLARVLPLMSILEMESITK